MFKLFSSLFVLSLVIFPAVVLFNNGCALAQEDQTDDEIETGDPEATATTDEDTESKVETEDDGTEAPAEETEKAESAEDESEVTGLRSHPDVELSVLFPSFPDKQLPAGKPINALIGFANRGLRDFTFETIDASFRYPQDYSYSVQNFTGYRYNRLVEQNHEAAFEYNFHPHESYGGRPFGLVIMATYKDDLGTEYGGAVFNETITFQELDESFDGETFFLYVFLAALALLVIFGVNYAFSSAKGKKTQSKSSPVEVGTQHGDVDYDWLPKETTTDFSKSSPRRSPRQRKVKRSSGSGDE
ncbi:translocon-associated protein subunit alpha-like [Rhopilema esculentum]|uniref:translocon-associated protein subunit alpha-like n=1 Tax=Rhopilema esculentum TaxID=499914 RepID=UPI0031E32DAB|eukprot:gene1489-15924_t